VACAVAAALELGVPADAIGKRLGDLRPADHRLTTSTGGTGFTIVDDTYNANPAGAQAALAALDRLATPGRKRVVVTPGMVELGPKQDEENERFGADAATRATHLVVVGHTNRRALLRGAAQAQAEARAQARSATEVVRVEHRNEAVAWVREHVQAGDVVLYENDLPDHFP
jgi:UDP-N-acetylmuramoyl-tripeptide--D-alanyl-D-alanine ligase